MGTKNIKLTVEYDGSRFAGWQTQEGLSTVQGELERGLTILLKSLAKKQQGTWDEPVSVIGSGRTDAGVHARGQVANFLWPEAIPFDGGEVAHSLNGITPPGLVIRSAEVISEKFHARLTPHLKCYRYTLLLRDSAEGYYSGRVWRVRSDLHVGNMIRAARAFRGQHDFATFRASDCAAKSTVRTIVLSELTRTSAEELTFEIHGKGFLKQMVRILVGTLVDVGTGKLPSEEMSTLLRSNNRTLAGQTAPPHGLVLEWVKYLERDYFESDRAVVEEDSD